MRPLLLVAALLELAEGSFVRGPPLRSEAPPRRRQSSLAELRMGAFALKPMVKLDADVGAAYERTKIGVLLLNLGGPDDLDAVEPFLCAGSAPAAPLPLHPDAPLHTHLHAAPQGPSFLRRSRTASPHRSAERLRGCARAQVQPVLRPRDYHAAPACRKWRLGGGTACHTGRLGRRAPGLGCCTHSRRAPQPLRPQ